MSLAVKSFISLAAATTLSAGALAQPTQEEREVLQMLAGTIYVTPHRGSADGVLDSCGLEFSALGADHSTKRGAPVKVVGSYYLRKHPTVGLAYALKLGIYDGLNWTTASPPNNAFVRAPRGPSPGPSSRSIAETPGYALFVGVLDASFPTTYASIVDNGELVVGFNRAPKQQDVTIALDLQVRDTKVEDGRVVRDRTRKMIDEFISCTSELIKTVKLN